MGLLVLSLVAIVVGSEMLIAQRTLFQAQAALCYSPYQLVARRRENSWPAAREWTCGASRR